MKHKTLETTTTATDQGTFSALAATYSLDRDGEQIRPGAFKATIAAWKSSNKNLPVHWAHMGEAENIIGHVLPASMKETKQGLYVEGKLDLEESEVAREAWRSMKSNAVSLSFGFLAKSHEREDGVVEITDIDLYEISIVPGPANPDTRFLSLKNLNEARELVGLEPAPTEDIDPKELRRRTSETALEIARDHQPTRKSVEVVDEAKVRALIEEELEARTPPPAEIKVEASPPAEVTVTDPKTLRRRSFDAAHEIAVEHPATRKSVEPPDEVPEPEPSEVEVDDSKVTVTIEPPAEPVESELVEAAVLDDPLRKQTFDVALGISNGGMKVRKHLPEPEPEPESLDAVALRRRCDELALSLARGQ